MKFGVTFMEYLHGEQERFLGKCSHVEYKRLKKVLKRCRTCRSLRRPCDAGRGEEEGANGPLQLCRCEACPVCDQMIFCELMKEASEIAGCFNSRVRHLLHLLVATGIHRYIQCFRPCFKGDQQVLLEEGRMLIEYVTMNAIAIRKILKKYDKVHGSVNGEHFRSKMRAEHIELLQSPWLIELGAFYLNFRGLDAGECAECSTQFSFHFDETKSALIMSLPGSIKLEHDLTCAICLDTVFNPYALSCGHLFCKSCACSAASVMIFEGLKAASEDAKCPVCREAGVYGNSVHMSVLNLLLKKRCKEYWEERSGAERDKMLKQSKEYWDRQTKYMIGY